MPGPRKPITGAPPATGSRWRRPAHRCTRTRRCASGPAPSETRPERIVCGRCLPSTCQGRVRKTRLHRWSSERPASAPQSGWVPVTVGAASLNMHDVWTLRGVGIAADRFPMILGCDAAVPGMPERRPERGAIGRRAPGRRDCVGPAGVHRPEHLHAPERHVSLPRGHRCPQTATPRVGVDLYLRFPDGVRL